MRATDPNVQLELASEIVLIPARTLLDLIRTAERWPGLLDAREPDQQTEARDVLAAQAPYTYALLVDFDTFGDEEA